MITRKTILSICIAMSASLWAQAQSNIVVSGGEASGTGGRVSYSVGQVDYTQLSGTGGKMTLGVQQPFEIYPVTGTGNTKISLQARVYPNPASQQLILHIDGSIAAEQMSYRLLSLDGKQLDRKKISGTETSIDLTSLANGAYLVQVLSNNTETKTFKVIKNK